MSDETTDAKPEATQSTVPNVKILGQYIKDMSFENAVAQKGAAKDVVPEGRVQVNLDAKKRGAENQYEVAIKLNVTNINKNDDMPLFVLEIEYSGIFQVENVDNAQLHPFLLIECPRMIFPYLRRIVSDITHDGGFPAVNLETIDFVSLYKQELQRRAEQNQAADSTES